jgi:hypothetical protein
MLDLISGWKSLFSGELIYFAAIFGGPPGICKMDFFNKTDPFPRNRKDTQGLV